jgi:hypothetical protein
MCAHNVQCPDFLSIKSIQFGVRYANTRKFNSRCDMCGKRLLSVLRMPALIQFSVAIIARTRCAGGSRPSSSSY